MSLSAAVIATLVSKGMSAQDILDVALASEIKSDPTNAQRQARFRASKKLESNGVTATRDTLPNDKDILTPPVTPLVISDEITPPSEIEDDELKPEHVIEAWNGLAERYGLPSVKKLTPERRKKLNTFIHRWTIDDITEAIEAIPRSPFLLGEGGRGWKATFDWFLEPRNITKLTEGTYVH